MELAGRLAWYRLDVSDERRLQDAIAAALQRERLPFVREARLSARDRVDFLVGRIALEVKVDGSPAEVARQLLRYTKAPVVTEVLLVTTRVQHRRVALSVPNVYVLAIAWGVL